MRMEIDLKLMEGKLDGMINKTFKLVRSENGVRQRGSYSRRNEGKMFILFPKESA